MIVVGKLHAWFGVALLGFALVDAGSPRATAASRLDAAAAAALPDSLAQATEGGPRVPAPRAASELGLLGVDPRRELTMHPIPLPPPGTSARGVQLPPLNLVHPFRPAALTTNLQLSRFDTGLIGASRGAYAGMALGFIGTQSAVWSQRTSFALMGIGAALGALWGSTLGNDDRGFQINVEPPPWDRQQLDRWDRARLEQWDHP